MADVIINGLLIFITLLGGAVIFVMFWRLGNEGDRGYIPRVIGGVVTALYFVGAILIW